MPDPVRPRPDPIAALVERWGVVAKEHARMDSRRPADIEGAEHFRAAAVYQQCAKELSAALRANADASPKENMMDNEPMLQFFEASHLPAGLREVSQPFCNLAHEMTQVLSRNPERTVMLRKLLEAKDCAVRARLMEQV